MEIPKFSDYRRTQDGVMVADLGFKKQLWALDKELDIVWDQGSERWEIWRFPGQKNKKKKLIDDKAHHVMKIETKDKNFRELGADILLKLQFGDSQRFTLEQLEDYFNELDNNIHRARYNSFMNDMGWLEEDFRRYRGIPFTAVPKNFMIDVPKRNKIINAVGVENA